MYYEGLRQWNHPDDDWDILIFFYYYWDIKTTFLLFPKSSTHLSHSSIVSGCLIQWSMKKCNREDSIALCFSHILHAQFTPSDWGIIMSEVLWIQWTWVLNATGKWTVVTFSLRHMHACPVPTRGFVTTITRLVIFRCCKKMIMSVR